MAYMNFNTSTKFWSTLCVQSFDNIIPSIYDKGCIAFHDTSNNGIMSIKSATQGAYEWKPIVHTVVKGTDSDEGNVVQDGGIVTVSFPKNSGSTGNCTKKTIVSNVSIGSNYVSNIIVPLPDTFDNTSSFLMTTVYEINDKGSIQSTLTPKVFIVNSDSSFGVNFEFDPSINNKKIKAMILFDKTADHYDSSVYNNTNWSTYNASDDIPTRTPGTKDRQ